MNGLNRRDLLTGGTAIGACTVLNPFSMPTAHAAAPLAGKQAPGFYRYKVGEIEITAILDGVWMPDLSSVKLAQNATVDEMRKVLEEQFQPTDKLHVPFTALLINTGSKLVLLDTGTAGLFVPTAVSFMNNFTAAGFDPKQVDIVAISHFHGDHINGIRTKDGQLAFPNAEIMVPAPEWDHWMDEGKVASTPEFLRGNFKNSQRVFGSIAKDVKRYEPGKEITTGITSIAAYGHTPGHCAFAIASGGSSMMTIVDAVNNAYVFLRNPDWQFSFDIDGPMAVQTRKQLLDRAVSDRMLVAAYHWPFPAVGHITKEGGGYRLNPAAYAVW
jgi:glyoxylase-like metal-dependent hydrolase (beta-lactamase superfamily II)